MSAYESAIIGSTLKIFSNNLQAQFEYELHTMKIGKNELPRYIEQDDFAGIILKFLQILEWILNDRQF